MRPLNLIHNLEILILKHFKIFNKPLGLVMMCHLCIGKKNIYLSCDNCCTNKIGNNKVIIIELEILSCENNDKEGIRIILYNYHIHCNDRIVILGTRIEILLLCLLIIISNLSTSLKCCLKLKSTILILNT